MVSRVLLGKALCAFTAVMGSHSFANKILPIDYEIKGKGVLLQITDKVPVFQKPNPQSAKLATAEEGTVLLAMDLSPKRTWVLVEDDQGLQGWVPLARTDLPELLEAQIKIRQAELETIREQIKTSDVQNKDLEGAGGAEFKSTSQVQHVLGPSMRIQNSEQFYGIRYSLLFDFYIPQSGVVRRRSFGAEFSWQSAEQFNQYEFMVRYASRFSFNPKFFYGPDFGFYSLSSLSSNTVFLGYRLGYEMMNKFPVELRSSVTTNPQSRWLFDLMWRMKF